MMNNTPAHSVDKLLVAMELSNSKWLLAFHNGDKIRRKSIDARDRKRFLKELALAKDKLGLSPDAPVNSCYEAGCDGFWIHRWLESEGIRNLVLDPASIEVPRRKRRAKTDRLDVESLIGLLKRYLAGDHKACSVVKVPTPEEEDALRIGRELERMKKECNMHTNRIKGLLVLHGLRIKGTLRGLRKQLDSIRLWDGSELPPNIKAELDRELDRLELLLGQRKALKAERKSRLDNPPSEGDRKAAELTRLRGVGMESAWPLAQEFFGWREFRNRRQVGALAGLTPTPYDSGNSRVEQGISKAGSGRIRRIMVELAWSWLKFQPQSKLAQWYEERYGAGSKRSRRIGIVALARKLLVALWKFVEFGEVPEGAIVS
jgi:transposase